jgi:hypothetical protein
MIDPAETQPDPFAIVRELPAETTYPKGVRTFMTKRVFIKICRRVEVGWPATRACQAEGITYRRFRQVCQERPSYQRRYKKAEDLRFQHRREEAEESIMRAGERSWMAHAWWLERTLPEKYALRRVDRDDPQAAEKPTYAQLTREELLESIEREKRLLSEAPPGYQQPALPDTDKAAE